MSLRVGLLLPQTASLWAAGNMYFENLLESSLLAAGPDERLVAIAPDGAGDASGRFPNAESASYAPPLARSGAGMAARLVRKRIDMPEPELASAIKRSGVDVVFGDANQTARYSVPWVGWIPDFQHCEAPEYFTVMQRAERDEGYSRMARYAKLILLSSEDARSHFERFAPEHASMARVAPFVSLMADDVFESDPGQTVREYGIEGRFVLVPNQWWRHKNHEVAIRAAALLNERGSDLTWVFTGALADYRDSSHISALLQLIARLGLSKHVSILGMLPRDEQLQLMRAAEMVVQPSLFEGWSTVVEDARTLGQRLVVSDLAVHREQDPPASLFFEPSSPEDLADKVAAMLNGACTRPDEAGARAASIDRARVFGRRFLDICAEAAGRS
ncbi:MAG: glycosyltransferase family 4 protein [Coriobacteriia bacterium]